MDQARGVAESGREVPEGGGTEAESAPDRNRGSSGKKSVARSVMLGTVPVVVLIGIWWLATETVLPQERIYPPPLRVLEELVRILSNEGPVGTPYAHLGATVRRLVIAFAIAFVGGTLIGILAGRVKAMFDFLNSLVWIAMAVPSVVWIFIFVIVYGISNVVPIAALVVLLGAPILLGTAEGVKSTPDKLVTMAASYKAGTRQKLVELYLPSIAPYMAANARVAFSLGIKIVIIAEVIGLPDGVGLMVRYWSDRILMAPVVAWGLVLMALGLVVDRLVFGPLERRTRRWTGGVETAAKGVE